MCYYVLLVFFFHEITIKITTEDFFKRAYDVWSFDCCTILHLNLARSLSTENITNVCHTSGKTRCCWLQVCENLSYVGDRSSNNTSLSCCCPATVIEVASSVERLKFLIWLENDRHGLKDMVPSSYIYTRKNNWVLIFT